MQTSVLSAVRRLETLTTFSAHHEYPKALANSCYEGHIETSQRNA